MREHAENGLRLRWEEAGAAPAVPGALARTVRALVRASPAHPANAVRAVHAAPGGVERVIRGHAIGLDRETGEQLFALDLPAGPGAWRPILSQAGREADPRRAAPDPRPGPRTARPPDPAPAARAPSRAARLPLPKGARAPESDGPTFPLRLEFLFRVVAPFDMDPTPVGKTPDGLRVMFALRAGGVARGPALEGAILPRGGDWMRVRPDGVGIVDVHALIQPPGGGVVLTEYSGVCDFGPDGFERLAADDPPPSAVIRFAPRYLTTIPRLEWMNRLQCFSVGAVDLASRLVEYDDYAARP